MRFRLQFDMNPSATNDDNIEEVLRILEGIRLSVRQRKHEDSVTDADGRYLGHWSIWPWTEADHAVAAKLAEF